MILTFFISWAPLHYVNISMAAQNLILVETTNTKNSIFITKTLQGLTVEEKQQYFETFVISHLMSMSSIVTNLLMYGLLNKNFRNGLSSIRRRHNPGTGETAV